MMRLILPDTKYLASYTQALREGYYLGNRPTVPEEEIKEIEADPHPHFLNLCVQGGSFIGPDGITRARVPFNYYWLIDNGEFIGAVDIRVQLNDFLEQHGGHIGYGIRPSKRRLGYAKKILHLGLEKLASTGATEALVKADEANVASWKAIEANGGALTHKSPSVFHEESVTRHYKIDLSKLGPMP